MSILSYRVVVALADIGVMIAGTIVGDTGNRLVDFRWPLFRPRGPRSYILPLSGDGIKVPSGWRDVLCGPEKVGFQLKFSNWNKRSKDARWSR